MRPRHCSNNTPSPAVTKQTIFFKAFIRYQDVLAIFVSHGRYLLDRATQPHPYLEPSNRTMRITKKGSNTVVTLVAGRVDSRWFKSILPVAFEEKGLFQCYFFSFPYKELTATMQGCNYHWRLSNSLAP